MKLNFDDVFFIILVLFSAFMLNWLFKIVFGLSLIDGYINLFKDFCQNMLTISEYSAII